MSDSQEVIDALDRLIKEGEKIEAQLNRTLRIWQFVLIVSISCFITMVVLTYYPTLLE